MNGLKCFVDTPFHVVQPIVAESAKVTSADPSFHVSEGGAQVGPEETHTYELGSKMVLLDDSMNLNIAMFYTEISDFQKHHFSLLM